LKRDYPGDIINLLNSGEVLCRFLGSRKESALLPAGIPFDAWR